MEQTLKDLKQELEERQQARTTIFGVKLTVSSPRLHARLWQEREKLEEENQRLKTENAPQRPPGKSKSKKAKAKAKAKAQAQAQAQADE